MNNDLIWRCCNAYWSAVADFTALTVSEALRDIAAAASIVMFAAAVGLAAFGLANPMP